MAVFGHGKRCAGFGECENMATFDKYTEELINEGAKLKTWDAPNNPGCKYCQDAVPLVIGETNDYGIVISAASAHKTATIMAYGYDVHGSGSNGLSAKINFCPMCGKKLYQEKRREIDELVVADEECD